MKQTQTKLFDFSDAGLDFSAGSKNLFPDRFKKMLALGYNEQTVLSVTVLGNQVTFTYGGVHGYVADRVLKVDSGDLAAINDGEFWIDSVTTNSITFTLDEALGSISAGFTTRIAPLGYELVYESTYIHAYKFKALDESDLYLRLCFQDVLTTRNCIAPCVGKSVNLSTGVINDAQATPDNAAITTVGAVSGFRWEMSSTANTTSNSYTYTQGYSAFGNAMLVGSLYHFVLMTSNNQQASWGRIGAVLPCAIHPEYSQGYPVLWGERGTGGSLQLSNAEAYIGNIRVVHVAGSNALQTLFTVPQAYNSFISLDSFNTTTAEPIPIYEGSTKQHLGYAYGLYICKYSNSNAPTVTGATSPSLTKDIDLQNLVAQHYIASGTTAQNAVFFAVPVEEIKVA